MNPPHFVDAASRATEHPGYPAPVADTIGAGDAFTAMTMDRYLRGATPEEISDSSNRVGAWVTSQVGATPPENGSLIRALAEMDLKKSEPTSGRH